MVTERCAGLRVSALVRSVYMVRSSYAETEFREASIRVALLLLLFAPAANAQTVTGQITGHILDPSCAAVVMIPSERATCSPGMCSTHAPNLTIIGGMRRPVDPPLNCGCREINGRLGGTFGRNFVFRSSGAVDAA